MARNCCSRLSLRLTRWLCFEEGLEGSWVSGLQLEKAVAGQHAVYLARIQVFPFAEDDHMAADLLDLVEQVGGQQNGGALRGDELDQLANLVDALGVEPVGGFVQYQDLGVVQQGRGDGQALLHPQGIGAELAVAPLPQPDQLQFFLNARFRHFFDLADQFQVLYGRHIRVEVGPFDNGPHLFERLVG